MLPRRALYRSTAWSNFSTLKLLKDFRDRFLVRIAGGERLDEILNDERGIPLGGARGRTVWPVGRHHEG